jgi:Ser/Thr protein kinase RdoA (MazF antagonist)
MVRYANIIDAGKAVALWGGDPQSVVHLGDRGNSVFSFHNSSGAPQILRFTDPDFRSYDELMAEINFVNGLHAAGVAVARTLPTLSGSWAVETECSLGRLIGSSIAYAPGVEVQEGSPEWDLKFFREWGRNLAQIHAFSATLKPASEEHLRWQWDEEILFARAEQLIPKEDVKSRDEFHEVMENCRSLEKTALNFGLIHADHAPQNFRYDANDSRITAFDFGNCCYHWFVADLAISLSTVRKKSNREYIRENILEGYASVRALPKDLDHLMDLFIRLRVVYVYLSRLHFWSQSRTAEQARDLLQLRESVHARTGWRKIETIKMPL